MVMILLAAADAAHEASGGLPQLNVLFDGSFTNQIIWLALTFAFLYIVLSQVVLPRLGSVLTEREEAIAADHDRARNAHREAEKIKAAYEDNLAKARAEAQASVGEARAAAAKSLADAQARLDQDLAKLSADAEKRIKAAVADAMTDIGAVASEVAADLYTKLTGEDAKADAVRKAVDAKLQSDQGAQ